MNKKTRDLLSERAQNDQELAEKLSSSKTVDEVIALCHAYGIEVTAEANDLTVEELAEISGGVPGPGRPLQGPPEKRPCSHVWEGNFCLVCGKPR